MNRLEYPRGVARFMRTVCALAVLLSLQVLCAGCSDQPRSQGVVTVAATTTETPPAGASERSALASALEAADTIEILAQSASNPSPPVDNAGGWSIKVSHRRGSGDFDVVSQGLAAADGATAPAGTVFDRRVLLLRDGKSAFPAMDYSTKARILRLSSDGSLSEGALIVSPNCATLMQ